MPVSPHEVSVHPGGSIQTLSTDSNLRGCLTLLSSERKSGLWNPLVGVGQEACPEHAVYHCCRQDVDQWCKEDLQKNEKQNQRSVKVGF